MEATKIDREIDIFIFKTYNKVSTHYVPPYVFSISYFFIMTLHYGSTDIVSIKYVLAGVFSSQYSFRMIYYTDCTYMESPQPASKYGFQDDY